MSDFLKNVSQPDQFKAFSSNKFLTRISRIFRFQ